MYELDRAVAEGRGHSSVMGRWVSDDRGDWLALGRSEPVAEAESLMRVASPLVGR
jgi:hypothetical protein